MEDASVAVRRAAGKDEQDGRPAAGPEREDRPPQGYRPVKGMPVARTGLALQLTTAALESPLGGFLFNLYIGTQPGMQRVCELLREERIEEVPRPTSLHEETWGPPPAAGEEDVCTSSDPAARLQAALVCVQRGGAMAGSTKCATAASARPTVLDYHFAYTQGMVTPSEVAERVIAFLQRHNPANHWLSAWEPEAIREAAAASSGRYAAHAPLSVLDGVPFVVKDCIDALPYATTHGTTFMAALHPATADAPCVAALKQLGGLLLGKAAMNEYGLFAHGHNSHPGTTRNPHAPTKTAGGSSSGAAAAVAAGLCPIAVGADGGGSVRIPAAMCGVFGLKTTTGRLADDCGAHDSYTSLVVSGPIANSVADLTLLYAVMANEAYPNADTRKPGAAALCLPGVEAAAAAAAAAKPKPLALPHVLVAVAEEADHSSRQAELADSRPLQGLRVGVHAEWFNDCTPEVAGVAKTALARLLKLGATQVDITLPDYDLVQAGHIATWAKEKEADGEAEGWLHDWSLRRQLNWDTRAFFALASNFTQQDYLQAQRMRARTVKHFQAAFETCDVILTPATPSAATDLPPGHDTTGVFDSETTMATVRFTQAANVTGLPALAMPAGRQLNGMPVGVQLMGRPFAEATLLRVAAALEQCMLEDAQPKPMPGLLLNPIACEKGAHPRARAMTQKLWASKYSGGSGGGGGAK